MSAKLLPMPIAHRLYNLRIESGLSKEEVARRLGVTKQAVYQWENGLRIPRIANLVTLADIYNTSVDYILGRNLKTLVDWDDTPSKLTSEELLDIQDQEQDVRCSTCRYKYLPFNQATPCGFCGNTFDNWEAKK